MKLSFILGAVLTFLGSLLHIAILIGGPDWYLASGAGEDMAKLAESGSMYPPVVGTILVCIFFGWSLYALSGAGIIRKLPLLKLCLILIAGLCIVRGLYGFFIPFLFNNPYVASLGVWFWVYSSIIWLAIGVFYAVGIRANWYYISAVKT
ncbi:MAG: hypothetical protein ACSHW0_19580 [Thalassotalea sp.]